ncbi:MAG: hypothetical protein KDJ41_17015 [Hyphomicrobiaceae bacterium]|nr:hypothetical protein [Hyphomicrobiaceae bacterium]
MATLQYSSLQDGGPDDLPRTLKREREAREREAREREARERETLQRDSLDAPVGRSDGADLGAPGHPGAHGAGMVPDLPVPPASALQHHVVVTRFQVPFFHLMGFFLKCVLAGIPALILLGALLYGAGEILQTYFPWLVKMRILVHFPG